MAGVFLFGKLSVTNPNDWSLLYVKILNAELQSYKKLSEKAKRMVFGVAFLKKTGSLSLVNSLVVMFRFKLNLAQKTNKKHISGIDGLHFSSWMVGSFRFTTRGSYSSSQYLVVKTDLSSVWGHLCLKLQFHFICQI